MLMRIDPFSEFDRLTDRVFGTLTGPAVMPMDAYEADGQFVARFDLPGVEPSSIDLTVEKNVLTVSAERQWEPTKSHQVVLAERPQGRFRRQLFLGENLDTEHITAGYDQGVLTVSIPMAEQAKPRKIEINGAKAQAIEAGSTAA